MSKIIIVEDNPDHALLIVRGLRENGLDVAHYPDGAALLDSFKKESASAEAPDIILLDLKLPGIDGLEILRRIRAHPKYRLIPVVMLTTSKYRKEINQAYELGASGFVNKSEDFPEFVAKLARVKDYWLRTVERPQLGD